MASALDGCVYHMVHFNNVESIFLQGALFSKEILNQKGIVPHSIAYESVQSLRDRIFIWDFFEKRYRSFHRYVPFYFAERPPMLYARHISAIQEQLVIFEVNRIILKDQGVLFTNGNASIQCLSQQYGEKVGIVPATLNGPCSRSYRPRGPYGSGQQCSDFYGDITFLSSLDWEGINNRRYIAEWGEYQRIRSAEVLIPDNLPLEKIQGIAVKTKDLALRVNALVTKYKLAGIIPFASIKLSLFL